MKEIIEQIEALIRTDFDGSNSYGNYCLGVNDTIGNVLAILESQQGKEEKEAVEAVSFALWIACNGYVYHSVIGKYSRNAGKLYSPAELYSQYKNKEQ